MENGQKFYLPSNDYIFKAMMTRNADLLRDFLGSVLPDLMTDFADCIVENGDLLGESTDAKLFKLDLVVTTRRGNTINIEMQVCHEPGLENRMQLYLARNHARQLDSGDCYNKQHRTYSIWLCKFNLHEDDRCLHDFVLYDPVNQIAFPNSVHLMQLELPKFAGATGRLHDWLKFFAADTEEEVMSMATASMTMEQASAFVHRMNMTPRERALADAYEREIYEKKAAYAEGVEFVARNMLREKFPLDQIAKITGFSVPEVEQMAEEESMA